jgi:hypothetical protein
MLAELEPVFSVGEILNVNELRHLGRIERKRTTGA